MSDTASSKQNAADRWPKQIKFIVGNEACERFSYYGMRSILAGYITGEVLKGGLGRSADFSTEVIHLFVFVNYFMPLLGAWLSDKLIGRYHTILWVSLFYCAGHGVLACSDLAHSVHGKLACLYAGLALIAFGSGGIKPCVSAFMGDQFRADQSHLLQKAYGAFYWSINFGSFFSFLVIPWIKNHYSYSYAFAVPGILMGIATFIFWLGSKYYVRIPPARETRTPGFFAVFGAAMKNYSGFALTPLIYLMTTVGLPVIAMICMTVISVYAVFSNEMTTTIRAVGWFSLICVGLWYLAVVISSLAGKFELPDSFWQSARSRFGEREIAAARSVGPILFVFALIPIFFSLFDQTNSTWVLQGEKMLPYDLFRFRIGAEEMQSMNPAIVMILVPLFTLGIYPRIGKFASPLRRMAAGMFLAAASYLVVAALQQRIEAGAQLSVLWQTVPYVILTAAEVLVSTTGLEFAFREAAPEMKSTIVSFWLVTTAFGDLLVAAITRTLSSASNTSASVSTGRFLVYAGATFVVAILFSIVAAFYKYRDEAAARGK
jgi:POT family proton-dependent oligopeptide transporter